MIKNLEDVIKIQNLFKYKKIQKLHQKISQLTKTGNIIKLQEYFQLF